MIDWIKELFNIQPRVLTEGDFIIVEFWNNTYGIKKKNKDVFLWLSDSDRVKPSWCTGNSEFIKQCQNKSLSYVKGCLKNHVEVQNTFRDRSWRKL